MSIEIPYDRSPPADAGRVVPVSPLVRRIVADNSGPFTFTGTCTYLVGTERIAVIDPGPEDDAHFLAIMAAIGTAPVEAILVTHTHKDHSPLARRLKAATSAPIFGAGPHRSARSLSEGEINALDASSDRDHQPDRELGAGDFVSGPGWTIETVPTPGHTMNHLAFGLREEEALFSGDHVMAWSTSIVAPPDGAMGTYMASLETLLSRPDRIYWPGHGGPVTDPARFVRALHHHRRMREAAILDQVRAGQTVIAGMVEALYAGLDPRLKPAAALSVLAHLEDLCARGLIRSDGAPRLESVYHAP